MNVVGMILEKDSLEEAMYAKISCYEIETAKFPYSILLGPEEFLKFVNLLFFKYGTRTYDYSKLSFYNVPVKLINASGIFIESNPEDVTTVLGLVVRKEKKL